MFGNFFPTNDILWLFFCYRLSLFYGCKSIKKIYIKNQITIVFIYTVIVVSSQCSAFSCQCSVIGQNRLTIDGWWEVVILPSLFLSCYLNKNRIFAHYFKNVQNYDKENWFCLFGILCLCRSTRTGQVQMYGTDGQLDRRRGLYGGIPYRSTGSLCENALCLRR